VEIACGEAFAFVGGMKAFVVFSVAVLMVGAMAQPVFAEEKKAAAETAKGKSKDVSPDEAEKLMKENPGMTILDVRTPEEFAEGHIKGAVNVNVHEADFEKQVAKLDQTKPVMVHCGSGRRSTEALEEMGDKVKFPQIYHLNNGFRAWKAAGKPVEKGGANPAK
jgi:rhodanese-related sulfurtransferase